MGLSILIRRFADQLRWGRPRKASRRRVFCQSIARYKRLSFVVIFAHVHEWSWINDGLHLHQGGVELVVIQYGLTICFPKEVFRRFHHSLPKPTPFLPWSESDREFPFTFVCTSESQIFVSAPKTRRYRDTHGNIFALSKNILEHSPVALKNLLNASTNVDAERSRTDSDG